MKSLCVILIYFYSNIKAQRASLYSIGTYIFLNACALSAETNLIDGNFILGLVVKPDKESDLTLGVLWQLLVNLSEVNYIYICHLAFILYAHI